jgi:hypothetical protein
MMHRVPVLLSLSILVILVGCSGGDGPVTPTAAAPIPAADTCNSIGGASTSGIGIFNGADCAPERSSVVKLNLRNGAGDTIGGCSGTVIAPRAVLTAAHCLDEGVALVRVWPGAASEPEIVAQSFAFYPDFKFNQSGFDVGVVLMSEDLPRSSIPILTSREGRVGEAAIIAGWGRDQNNTVAFLRAGSTTLSGVSGELLRTIYAPPSSSVCQGDSGGPILLSEGGQWTIGGITSATSGNSCNTGTNLFQVVRHQPVRDFIRQHASNVSER